MSWTETTLEQFQQTLASKAAVPGGGGASALAGALGASLGAMVGNLTIGKKKYASVEPEIAALTQKAQALAQRLLALVDGDAQAFEPLSRAYGLPKDDPSRPQVMAACLRQAAQAPLDILQCCCEAIELLEEFAQKGSVLAISDAATGAALCWAAAQGAAINVKVNTKLMADRAEADQLNRQVDSLLAAYRQRAEDVYEEVYGRYC